MKPEPNATPAPPLTMTPDERDAMLATLGPRIAEYRAKAIPVIQKAVTRLGADECEAVLDALVHHGFVGAGPTVDRARCSLEGVLRGLNLTPVGWSDIWALLDSARLERDATRAKLAEAEALEKAAVEDYVRHFKRANAAESRVAALTEALAECIAVAERFNGAVRADSGRAYPWPEWDQLRFRLEKWLASALSPSQVAKDGGAIKAKGGPR